MAVGLASGWQNELVGPDNGRRYAAYFVPPPENWSAHLDLGFKLNQPHVAYALGSVMQAQNDPFVMMAPAARGRSRSEK
jgi:hypothetical protein